MLTSDQKRLLEIASEWKWTTREKSKIALKNIGKIHLNSLGEHLDRSISSVEKQIVLSEFSVDLDHLCISDSSRLEGKIEYLREARNMVLFEGYRRDLVRKEKSAKTL
jgi:hypothetical protein